MPVMEKSLMSGEGENAGDGEEEDGINIRLVRSEKMDPPTWLLSKISAKIGPPSLIPNVGITRGCSCRRKGIKSVRACMDRREGGRGKGTINSDRRSHLAVHERRELRRRR